MKSWLEVISAGLILAGMGLWSAEAAGKCGLVEPWIAGQNGDRLPPDPELYIFRAPQADLAQLEIRCEDDGQSLEFRPTTMLAAEYAGWSLTRLAVRSGDCRAIRVRFGQPFGVEKSFVIDPEWWPLDQGRVGVCVDQAHRESQRFGCGDHDVMRLRVHRWAPVYRFEFVASIQGRHHEFEQWVPTEVGRRCGGSADSDTTCVRLGEYMCWPDNYPTSLLDSPVRVRATAVYPDGGRVRGPWQRVSPGRGGLVRRDGERFHVGAYFVDHSGCRPKTPGGQPSVPAPSSPDTGSFEPVARRSQPLLWSILGLLGLLTLMAGVSWRRAQRWRNLEMDHNGP